MASAAIPLIGGILGLGGSIFNGIFGSGAAKKAAGIEQQAAQQAGNQVLAGATEANSNLINSASTQGQSEVQAAQWAGQGVTAASQQANALLDPYAATGTQANGTLAAGLAPGGQFSTAPTQAQVEMDPGFAASLAAGEKANERAAAAIGGVNSGSEAMALNAFAQNQTQQQYQEAFNRYETSTQNAFNNLNTVAGRGQQAATTQGTNTQNAATYSGNINYGASQAAANLNYGANQTAAQNLMTANSEAGNYLTQGANAAAAGYIGQANAVSSAVGQGISSIASAGNLYNQLNNPYANRGASTGIGTGGGVRV